MFYSWRACQLSEWERERESVDIECKKIDFDLNKLIIINLTTFYIYLYVIIIINYVLFWIKLDSSYIFLLTSLLFANIIVLFIC